MLTVILSPLILADMRQRFLLLYLVIFSSLSRRIVARRLNMASSAIAELKSAKAIIELSDGHVVLSSG